MFGGAPIAMDSAARQVQTLEKNCARVRRGVARPATMPSAASCMSSAPSSACPSRARPSSAATATPSTHGALGALAFGIGTTEVGHVLATQCLLQRKPRSLRHQRRGHARRGRYRQGPDPAIIGTIGVDGGTGHVIEYRGSTIRDLAMDERMTVCNMSIEAGARAGMIAPDEVTYSYLAGRPRAPTGAPGRRRSRSWRMLPTDAGRTFDREVSIDAARHPAHDHLRHPSGHGDRDQRSIPQRPGDAAFAQALATWDLPPANRSRTRR